jgi:hypothetical protein
MTYTGGRHSSRTFRTADHAAALALGVAVFAAWSAVAPAQQPAWDRVQERLSGARQMAEQAAEMAERQRDRVEEQIRQAEMGDAPADAAAEGDAASPAPSPEVEDALLNFGLEAEEGGAKDLFKEEQFVKMLGADPQFIYAAAGVADPMIFPPIRNEAIRNELWGRHEQLLQQAGLDPKRLGKSETGREPEPGQFNSALVMDAIGLLDQILNRVGDGLVGVTLVSQQKGMLEDLVQAPGLETGPTPPEGPAPTPVPEDPCELPGEIKSNLNGIVASGDQNALCLIGDYMVRLGETVPDYDNVRVVEINPGEVKFEVSGSCITAVEGVALKPNEESGFFGEGKGGRRRARR